jgi:hypothetical protein
MHKYTFKFIKEGFQICVKGLMLVIHKQEIGTKESISGRHQATRGVVFHTFTSGRTTPFTIAAHSRRWRRWRR